MQITIDWQRAKLVCGQLLDALRKRHYPYSELSALPQNMISAEIKADPLRHARILFYACHYMRGTIKSDHAIRALLALEMKHPEFFDPYYVAGMNSLDLLIEQLNLYIGYRTEQIAEFWFQNSRRLVEHWEGDPRNIFAGVSTPEEMYLRITNKRQKRGEPTLQSRDYGFLGFQKKMASMIAYFLMDSELVRLFSASPPVDFHLVRVMIATGILVAQKEPGEKYRYEMLTPKGIEVLEWYARTHEVTLVDLGNALWMLSVVVCKNAPGNMSTGRKKGEKKNQRRPVRVIPSFSNPAHVLAYQRSCGVCLVESICRFNIPSGLYYEFGELEVAARLRLMPQEAQSLFGWDELPGHKRAVDLQLRVASFTPRIVAAFESATEPLFGILPDQKRPAYNYVEVETEQTPTVPED